MASRLTPDPADEKIAELRACLDTKLGELAEVVRGLGDLLVDLYAAADRPLPARPDLKIVP
jgi:hypothetical protein